MLSAQIELDFADGSYICALLLPQLEELEEKCGFTDAKGNRRRRGVVAIYGDMIAGLDVQNGEIIAIPQLGQASGIDARHVIRLGLIGGGSGLVEGKQIKVDALLARSLCERYVDNAPIVKRWTLAAAILKAAIEGHEPKKAEPAPGPAAPAKPTRKPRSTSRKSRQTAP